MDAFKKVLSSNVPFHEYAKDNPVIAIRYEINIPFKYDMGEGNIREITLITQGPQNIRLCAESDCCGLAWFEIPEDTLSKISQVSKFVLSEITLGEGKDTVDNGNGIYLVCEPVSLKILDQDREEFLLLELHGKHNGHYPPFIEVKLVDK